ncbi:helix-turn-helix domain-containing protein [Cohnella cholangitidis]|uniref:Helix-turn-helix domain-containing protein n=1 Tax=Cohnella cholangitidis TaxID=2598458 RepID=A0A7G5BW35_9BACL|nr:helix-turn-helix domain-containing protein [Cohnella cholangitidis]QMV41169.1 helix-turn-helix domain-containing protein [Cohnella cholangitidis]
MIYDKPSSYAEIPKNVVVTGHFNEPDAYICTRAHGMNDCLITFTLDGEGYFRTPDTAGKCNAGDVTILKQGTPHEYGTAKGKHWHFYWMHFSVRSLEPELLPRESLFIDHIESESTRTRIADAFKRILIYSRERYNWKHELCTNALREILFLLMQKRIDNFDPRTEEVLHILSNHLRDRITIDDIAKSIGISPSRLSHIFKKDTGETIIGRLNQMRIQQAALLMKHSNRSPSEVCHDVGFHNYNHFINQFRKYYQTTPSAFKKEQLAQDSDR